jgi:hypothetical protein
VTLDDDLAAGGTIERLPIGATRDYNPIAERNRERRQRSLPRALSETLARLRPQGESAPALAVRLGTTRLNAYQRLYRLHALGLVTRSADRPAHWQPTNGSTAPPAT